jgi:hypothetical protein
MIHYKNIRLELVENGFTLHYLAREISDSTYGEPGHCMKEEVFKINEGHQAVDRMLELKGMKSQESESNEEDDEMNSEPHNDEIVPPETPRIFGY